MTLRAVERYSFDQIWQHGALNGPRPAFTPVKARAPSCAVNNYRRPPRTTALEGGSVPLTKAFSTPLFPLNPLANFCANALQHADLCLPLGRTAVR